jgi:hypothetical protein
MNALISPIITTTRKETVLILVTGMLMMILMLSFIVGGIANSVQAQKPSPTKTRDIFKVIVTLIGLNKTSGDIVSFVNVGGITQVKTFNAAKLVPMRGNNGTLEILFTFPNATINTGAKFRACTMLVKDLRMSCEKGQNSPALRPEFVDIYLSSAKSIKMSSSSSSSSQSSVDKKLGK